jgi:hypothetical protein
MNEVVLKIEYEKGDIWHNSLVHEYNDYVKSIKPYNHIHAYLVYTFLSTACTPAFSLKKDKIILVSSLMNDQNKPFHSYSVHKIALERFGVLGYSLFILFPMEFMIGIYQCVLGPHNYLYEYGFSMICLKCWRGLGWIYILNGFYVPLLPESYWPLYFRGLKQLLHVDNYLTDISSTPLDLYGKVQEGLLLCSIFAYGCYFLYNI